MRETDRLEAFSDGVMAVIITIMAFNVKPPAGASLSALRTDVPELLVYVLSFAIVGTYWNNHHHLLRATDRISGGVMWSNLLLLFWLSLLPIATGWVGQFPGEAIPTAFYGLLGLATAVAYWILVRAIIRANGRGLASGPSHQIRRERKTLACPLRNGCGLGISTPVAADVAYVAVAVMWFVPDRRLGPKST